MSAPRPAATVIVLRDAPRGLVVFMVRRHEAATFMPGAHVFPGGRVEAGESPPVAAVRELLEEAGIALAVEALVPFARWRTPPMESRRFDTEFFVARMPPGQTPTPDMTETTGGDWFTPPDALERCRRRDIVLPPPTWTTLRELEPHATVDEVIRWARTRSLAVREPKLVAHADRTLLVLPGDPLNGDPWSEQSPAETRFELEDNRWIPVAQA